MASDQHSEVSIQHAGRIGVFAAILRAGLGRGVEGSDCFRNWFCAAMGLGEGQAKRMAMCWYRKARVGLISILTLGQLLICVRMRIKDCTAARLQRADYCWYFVVG